MRGCTHVVLSHVSVTLCREGPLDVLIPAKEILPMFYKICGKGKAVLLQAWSRPEGSRKLRFPDFMTTAQEGDKVVSLMHRPHLPQGNSPGTHFC